MTGAAALGVPYPCPACGVSVIAARRFVGRQVRVYAAALGGDEAISGKLASFTRDTANGHALHECPGNTGDRE